ncbi:hypothetical protein CSUI_010647, partial [Cystoisospora suis]
HADLHASSGHANPSDLTTTVSLVRSSRFRFRRHRASAAPVVRADSLSPWLGRIFLTTAAGLLPVALSPLFVVTFHSHLFISQGALAASHCPSFPPCPLFIMAAKAAVRSPRLLVPEEVLPAEADEHMAANNGLRKRRSSRRTRNPKDGLKLGFRGFLTGKAAKMILVIASVAGFIVAARHYRECLRNLRASETNEVGSAGGSVSRRLAQGRSGDRDCYEGHFAPSGHSVRGQRGPNSWSAQQDVRSTPGRTRQVLSKATLLNQASLREIQAVGWDKTGLTWPSQTA